MARNPVLCQIADTVFGRDIVGGSAADEISAVDILIPAGREQVQILCPDDGCRVLRTGKVCRYGNIPVVSGLHKSCHAGNGIRHGVFFDQRKIGKAAAADAGAAAVQRYSRDKVNVAALDHERADIRLFHTGDRMHRSQLHLRISLRMTEKIHLPGHGTQNIKSVCPGIIRGVMRPVSNIIKGLCVIKAPDFFNKDQNPVLLGIINKVNGSVAGDCVRLHSVTGQHMPVRKRRRKIIAVNHLIMVAVCDKPGAADFPDAGRDTEAVIGIQRTGYCRLRPADHRSCAAGFFRLRAACYRPRWSGNGSIFCSAAAKQKDREKKRADNVIAELQDKLTPFEECAMCIRILSRICR